VSMGPPPPPASPPPPFTGCTEVENDARSYLADDRTNLEDGGDLVECSNDLCGVDGGLGLLHHVQPRRGACHLHTRMGNL